MCLSQAKSVLGLGVNSAQNGPSQRRQTATAEAAFPVLTSGPPASRGDRRRVVNVREVLNPIFYVLSTGCQWQALPKDLPPKSTAHSSVHAVLGWDGTLERVHHSKVPPKK